MTQEENKNVNHQIESLHKRIEEQKEVICQLRQDVIYLIQKHQSELEELAVKCESDMELLKHGGIDNPYDEGKYVGLEIAASLIRSLKKNT